MAQRTVWKKRWMLALGFLVLVCLVAVGVLWYLHIGQHSERKTSLSEPSEARLATIPHLVQALDRDLPSAIVRFQATPGKTGSRAPQRNFDRLGQEFDFSYQLFDIDGTFEVLADLHLRFPRWGYVDDFVKVSAVREDPAERRLGPLSEACREGRPLEFIAINGADSKAPRAATFIGSLKPSDLEYLPQLMEVLDKEPFADITEARAAAMVGDGNPWVSCLGLVRLKKLEVLTADHFLLAMARRTEEDVPTLLNEMFDAGATNEQFRSGFAERFVFRGLRPGQQKRALAALLTKYEGLPAGRKRWIDRYIDLPRWQAAVRAYLPEVRADPQRQEIIPLLEAVLELK